MIFHAVSVVKINFEISYITVLIRNIMTCFCGCETYVKDANGFKVGCVKCDHGPEESFKLKSNLEDSQKRGSLS
jgi:hypothetical protein